MSETENTTTPEQKKRVFTDAEKLDFYKSFLADKPFIGKIPLFDGNLVVEFRSLTTTETMEIFTLLRKQQIEGEVNNDTNYVTEVASMRLGLSLLTVGGQPFAPDLTPEASPKYITERAKIIKSWPVFKSAAIIEAFKQFEEGLLALTAEIQTENFWKAVK